MKIDIVHEFVVMAQEAAKMDAATAKKLENQLRARFAGEHFRVMPRPAVSIDEVNGLLLKKLTVNQIADRTGSSRSTIYRLLRAEKRQKRR